MYRFVIAFRYLRSRRITYFSILGVTVGVSALIIVLAVMEGFRSDFQNRIRGFLSDVIVRYRGEIPYPEVEKRLAALPHVKATAPRLKGMALISGPDGSSGVQIIGIDVAKEVRVSKLGEYIINSRLTSQAKVSAQDLYFLNSNVIMRLNELKNARLLSESRTRPFQERRLEITSLSHRLAKESQPKRMLALLDQAQKLFREYFDTMDGAPDLTPELREWFSATRNYVEEILDKCSERIVTLQTESEKQLKHFQRTGEFTVPFADPVNGREVILGEELLTSLGVRPGDTVRIYTAGTRDLASLEDNSKMAPTEFTVAGSFRSRMYRYDSRLVYMPLLRAQGFTGKEGLVSETGVKLDDFSNAGAVKESIRTALPGADVKTWAEKRKTLLAAIKLEKAFLTVVLFMIIVVAGFNMLATFLMMVTEKTRDLGILKSLGGSTLGISSIFFLCGVMIAVAGSALGTGIGLLFVEHINEIESFVEATVGITPFPRDVYYIDRIPTIIRTADVFWILFPTVTISVLLGSVFPALKAARLRPQAGLRYE